MFLLFEPLITMASIQYANDSDGRQRRKLYDQAYSHRAIRDYFDVFRKVVPALERIHGLSQTGSEPQETLLKLREIQL